MDGHCQSIYDCVLSQYLQYRGVSRGKDVKVIIKVSLSTHKHTHTSMQCQIASMVWYSDIEEKSLKLVLI